METDPATIDTIVKTIVATTHPIKVILFGSAARGDIHKDSDLDILVVMPRGVHRRETARSLRRALLPFGREIDLVVATEEDLRKHGDNFTMVYRPALREGLTLYAAG